MSVFKPSVLVALLLTVGLCQGYSVVSSNNANLEDEVGADINADHQEEYVDQARGFDGQLVDVDQDRLAFHSMIDALLWDSDDDGEDSGNMGRSFVRSLRRRGLFHRPMPKMFREEGAFTADLYRSFVDECYGLVCKLGLTGLASSLENLFG